MILKKLYYSDKDKAEKLIINIDEAIEKDKTIPDRIGYFDRVYEIIRKYSEQKV